MAQDYEGVFQQQGVRALQRYKGYDRPINEIYDKVHHINMLMSLMFTITYLLILVQNDRQESTKATLCTEHPATRPCLSSPLRRFELLLDNLLLLLSLFFLAFEKELSYTGGRDKDRLFHGKGVVEFSDGGYMEVPIR